MSFKIKVGINTSPENKISKTITDEKEITVEPIGPMSLTSPQFLLKSDNINKDYNYATIAEYGGRKYFIVDFTYDTAKRRVITLQEDALSTWASRLTDVKFNFVRGAATINETDDNSYPLADTLNVQNFQFSNWNNSFFTNSGDGQRYLLRVADGRAASWNYRMDFTIGSQFIYKNLLFTVEGTYSGAYLSHAETPLPPSQPYPQVAPGTVITVYETIDGKTYAQDYEFQERYQYGVPDPYYQLWAVDAS